MSLGRLGLVQAGSPDKQCPTLAELTADATATTSQIAEGATAYVQGEKITGTMPTTIDVAAAGIKFAYSTFETVPSYFDFSNVTNGMRLLNNCSSLTSIQGVNFYNVTNAQSMMEGCTKLSIIEGVNFPNVTNAISLFYLCSSLTRIQGVHFPSVINTQSMFQSCYRLETISEFDFSKVTTAPNMFRNCTNLTTIGNIIFLNTSLSLADSPNLDENTLSLFGIIATGTGQTGVADLKTIGLPSETITFNTKSQEFLESEGIIAKLTDSNWVVSFADSM